MVGQELQEVIYNVLPEYQEGLLYDPLAGPDGQDRSLCRDKEGILDDIPRYALNFHSCGCEINVRCQQYTAAWFWGKETCRDFEVMVGFCRPNARPNVSWFCSRNVCLCFLPLLCLLAVLWHWKVFALPSE